MLNVSTAAVIRVGDGRGFLVESRDPFMPVVVVTAANCLPYLPSAHRASYAEERTYANLLAPLGADPSVWAECAFADPIADIAVLRAPDSQSLPEQAEAFDLLLESRKPLRLGRFLPAAAEATVFGFVLPLAESAWQPRALSFSGHWVNVDGGSASGMSGSPILSIEGSVLALVSTGANNPIVSLTLPMWINELCAVHDAELGFSDFR